MGRSFDGERLAVEHMIGPGSAARHLRTSFQPDAEWQWSQMRMIFAASPGSTFVGDWHTHPGRVSGRLSRVDLKALAEILGAEETRATAVLSIILSGYPRRWSWRAWLAVLEPHRSRDPVVRRSNMVRT